MSTGGRRSTDFLVGRELCLFLCVDAERIPLRQRRDFVAMAVRRAAPFPDPRIELAWQGSQALAWYWSDARVDALAGGARRQDGFRAEAVFVGEPAQDGAQLLQLAHGVEARLWKSGRLLASRWWPGPPDEDAWRTFTRGAGFEPGTAPMPPTMPAPIQDRPWCAAGTQTDVLGQLAPRLPALGAGLACLLAGAFAWQLGGLVRAWWELRDAGQRATALEAELEPVLQAREQAEAARAGAEALLALRPPVPQLRLMAEAQRLMADSQWLPDLWAQPNPETIEVRFSAPSLDSESIVAAWEASPYFEEVSPSLSRQGDAMTLRARVVRPSAVAVDAAAPDDDIGAVP